MEKRTSVFTEKLKRGWYYFAAGLPLILAGSAMALVGNRDANPILIGIGFMFMVGGGILSYRGYLNLNVRTAANEKGEVKFANAMSIYEDHIEYEHENEPVGAELKCLNDGKFYHVRFMGMDGNGKSDFYLPDDTEDSQYYDPGEAKNVVYMESNRKYLNYSVSMGQKVSLITLGIIIGGELIAVVAVA